MLATDRPLKVLTPEYRQRLRAFNDTARALRGMGMRLRCLDLAANRLEIDAEDARRLLGLVRVEGFQRRATAGSTQYECQYQGVTLAWSEPISYRRPAEWAATVVH